MHPTMNSKEAECPPSQKDQVEPVDLSVNKSPVRRREQVVLKVPTFNPIPSVAAAQSSPPVLNPIGLPDQLDLRSLATLKKEQGRTKFKLLFRLIAIIFLVSRILFYYLAKL
ncbi:Hypothetical predicted protein [Cloeon dipterum]|nr:Hypothetical predicted protein [Cloeon dipterum]